MKDSLKKKKGYSKDFIRTLPKTDLHVHLDGSLRVSTLIDLAKKYSVKLPSYTEGGLRKTVFKKRYGNLLEYLKGFDYTIAVMQTPEALERVAYEFAMDCFADGVRYVEPRFAPQLHVNDIMAVEDVLISVNKGLARAKGEINASKAIASGSEPYFEYGIICCAMRMFNENFPGVFKKLMSVHKYMDREELYGLAALDLVESMIYCRDELGLPIVGFDLAGAESGYPAENYKSSFELAHKNFFRKTVHAGEAYGPESIFQAIADCHADRIGHGTHIFDASMVKSGSKAEKERYVNDLWQYVADSRMTVEVCLTSNLQTQPQLKSIGRHPVSKMLDRRLSFTFCTDNMLVSDTTATDEIFLAVSNFKINPGKLKDIVIYGFKRSFFPGDYLEKRRYTRNVIDYYERVEREFIGS